VRNEKCGGQQCPGSANGSCVSNVVGRPQLRGRNHIAAPRRIGARIKTFVVAAGSNTLYAVIPGPGRRTTVSDVGSATVR
jgi:hypothetical protein